jgi:uncharacterized damage-inducible protein DinB
MIDFLRETLGLQYGAGLRMLGTSIEQCTPQTWQATVGRHPFWHVAYHVLFYTDLYLSENEERFQPQPFHRQSFFDPIPWPASEQIPPEQPMDRPDLQGYVQICAAKVVAALDRETEQTLRGASGFSWLRFPRAQLHLYNIRHLQHHTGQLTALLSARQGRAVDWTGSHDPRDMAAPDLRAK